jgi:hypothetical protein
MALVQEGAVSDGSAKHREREQRSARLDTHALQVQRRVSQGTIHL